MSTKDAGPGPRDFLRLAFLSLSQSLSILFFAPISWALVCLPFQINHFSFPIVLKPKLFQISHYYDQSYHSLLPHLIIHCQVVPSTKPNHFPNNINMFIVWIKNHPYQISHIFNGISRFLALYGVRHLPLMS